MAANLAPPAGTLTMLFTDIELSTRHVQALGDDRWASILERHDRIIREALANHGGVEVRTAGDSFFAVFAIPAAAIDAAAAIQRSLSAEEWPTNAAPRVRMGVHTGEVHPISHSGADYVGLEVHRTARIAAAGHGGQVLISETTEALVRGSLVTGLTLQEPWRVSIEGPCPAAAHLSTHDRRTAGDVPAVAQPRCRSKQPSC
jgi:class 3 adenylate cyclase